MDQNSQTIVWSMIQEPFDLLTFKAILSSLDPHLLKDAYMIFKKMLIILR